jgi:hypothetical protein
VRYKCESCGSIFDEPESISYCKEEENGVADLFGRQTWASYDACPNCREPVTEYDIYYEEDDIDEF